MTKKEFYSLDGMQKYYDKKTNTYIFEENGELIDLVVFNVSIKIEANIVARCIDAYDIAALDITAWDIDALNITARDIKSWNISTLNIKARNINYDAVCFAYGSIICNSIKGRRANHKHFALDGSIKVLENEELCEKDLEILECFKKIPKQDLLDFINWQIRYEENFNTWLEGCNADLAKEDPTKHLIKIKEWLENE